MGASTSTYGVSPKRTYTFVPDEICIAVATDPGRSGTVYGTVQTFLNIALAGGKLGNLDRRAERWIVSLNETPTLLFYRLEQGDGDLDVRNDNIRRLVLTINRTFAGKPAGRNADDGWQIMAASPNWIGTASQPGDDMDSPAAPPKPAASSKQFRFFRGDQGRGSAELQDLVNNQRSQAAEGVRSDVVVAILDTCPPQNVIRAAAFPFGGSPLWQQVTGGTNPVSIDGSLFLSLSTPGGVWSEILPSWLGRLDAWYRCLDPAGRVDLGLLANLRATTYAMPDHGFFAAGIVKDIAPKAEIHLIQAIDDAGLTDLLEVTDALSVLPSTFGSEKRLIVNLSLTFTVPTFAEFMKQWSPLLAGLTQADYDLIHFSLGDVMTWLRNQGVVVVAAAGNYNMPGAGRPEPRFPAFYDSVFGVAAYTREFGAAAYSNRGDEIGPALLNGIATLGGNTITIGGQRNIATLSDGPDAIQGIFSAVDLPFFLPSPRGTTVPHGSNTTGWVYWVGTSFAAPIISAIAAVTWDRNLALSPAALISKVQGFADPAITLTKDLNCDAIWADQISSVPA